MRCIIPSEDSGSAPGSPENLQREASRRDPDQMPEPPIRSTQRSSGSNPSTATIRRTLISSTCIHHLVIWVTTHSSWPQVRVGLVNWDLHLPVQILLHQDGPVSKPPVQLMLHCSIPEKKTLWYCDSLQAFLKYGDPENVTELRPMWPWPLTFDHPHLISSFTSPRRRLCPI